MILLSGVCALILSLLASALAEPKEIAKDLDRSKQMMIAARILDHEGRFVVEDEAGKLIPAKYAGEGILEPGDNHEAPTRAQLLEVYKARLIPMLVSPQNKLVSFKEAGINEEQYVAEYRKSGYYKQPYKLIYKILPNTRTKGATEKAEGYVIPVNGFGLWDAIYGYLAVKPDGNTVIGISWYDQKETPGLGANIAEASWQNLFPGKKIFQPNADGSTEMKTAPLGITVVKGKVADVLGDSAKAKSAVDGMTGATLTGNGVTDAYNAVLAPYRQFFIELANNQTQEGSKKNG
jgi:Na+-transporting NADH:ubiquinone oxidoreductase subunit C